MAEQENRSSPLAGALARVGDRWTPLVAGSLLGGPQRFNDLLGQIPGSPRTFSPSASSGWSSGQGRPRH
jgi:DNA-binding HxlR family transcriptional regulator